MMEVTSRFFSRLLELAPPVELSSHSLRDGEDVNRRPIRSPQAQASALNSSAGNTIIL